MGVTAPTGEKRRIRIRPLVPPHRSAIGEIQTALGYADSEVATFSFKVKCGFTISGKVWNDTPLSTSKPDGIWKSGEEGINGIKVALYKANSSTLVATTTTATINGVAGSYTFTTPEDGSYQVAFEYNGQKYRAYEYVVSGCNWFMYKRKT